MGEIFNFFSQNPSAFIIVASISITLIAIIVLVFLDAYFDGREITLWPPKIGGKGSVKTSNKTEEVQKNVLSPIPKETTPRIVRTDIDLTSYAVFDCNLLGLSMERIKDFLLEETSRHPVLFYAPFSSMPFFYLDSIIFLSWDGSRAILERILASTEDAYPASKTWYTCTSLYRQATAFSYRSQSIKAVLRESEVAEILKVYRKLLHNVNNLVSLDTETENPLQESRTLLFNTLLDEAEFAFYKGNQDFGIVQLEALLSSIHKFLISSAPQAPSTTENIQKKNSKSYSKLMGETGNTILLIEDDTETLTMILNLLLEEGYRVATAENGEIALKAMVENTYDLIITDIMMPGVSGHEVINGARIICPKTKLLVITVLSESTIRKVADFGNDIYCMYKPFNLDDFTKAVDKLVRNPDNTSALPQAVI